jgi:hypothetical protein
MLGVNQPDVPGPKYPVGPDAQAGGATAFPQRRRSLGTGPLREGCGPEPGRTQQRSTFLPVTNPGFPATAAPILLIG